MTLLSAVRERLSARGHSDRPHPRGDAPARSTGEAALPFAGYDQLDDGRVIHGLSQRSQIELEAVESYERSHQNRGTVLDKLRWMRGREPLPGYDALGVNEIVARLGEADLATIWKVRAYERKFANRPAILDEVVRVHHRSLARRPSSAKPSYQPMGVTAMDASVVNSRGDRAERGQP